MLLFPIFSAIILLFLFVLTKDSVEWPSLCKNIGLTYVLAVGVVCFNPKQWVLAPSLMIIKKSQELPLFVNKFIDFQYDVVCREVFVYSTPA